MTGFATNATGPTGTILVAGLFLALVAVTLIHLRQRRQMRDVTRRHSLVLASITDYITFVDTDQRIVWSNWSPEGEPRALVGTHCFQALSGRTEPCGGCPVPEVLATGQPAEGVVTEVDGDVYRISAAPVFDQRKRLIGVVQLSRDITDKRRLAERLQQAEKMEAVGQLAAGVAHDFNNNLQVILGYSEMLASVLPAGSEGGALLAPVRRAAEQAREVVGHLLTFSRRQESRRQTLDLAVVIDGQVGALDRLLGDRVKVRWQPPVGPLPPVVVDAAQAQEVLLNLCLNARDAMPAGGEVTIGLASCTLSGAEAAACGAPSPGRYVVLSVADAGTGIAPEVRDRIFDPFFTTKGVDRGTGLGLSAVYGIVVDHGGYIDVRSTVGQGATFTVGWPVDTTPGPRSPDLPDDVPARVLLVEDDAEVREVAEAVLSREGYQVDTASDGRAALQRLEADTPRYDVVVMDVVLPGLNGWTVYRQACRRHPDLRVIFCSGHSSSQLESEFRMAIPELAFLQKPYRPADLIGRVQTVLAGDGMPTMGRLSAD
jgi:signal transduction histidine kinase